MSPRRRTGGVNLPAWGLVAYPRCSPSSTPRSDRARPLGGRAASRGAPQAVSARQHGGTVARLAIEVIGMAGFLQSSWGRARVWCYRRSPDGRWLCPTVKPSPFNYDLHETFNTLGVLVDQYALDKRYPVIERARTANATSRRSYAVEREQAKCQARAARGAAAVTVPIRENSQSKGV